MTKLRHAEHVENDEVNTLTTLSMTDLEFPLDYQNKIGQALNVKVKLSFNENQECTVAPTATAYQLNDTVRIYNIAASGTGKFVAGGEKNSWGNKDRDALYLQYSVGYEVEIKYPKLGLPDDIQQVTYNTKDTLVVRDRGVAMETFSPSYSVN